MRDQTAQHSLRFGNQETVPRRQPFQVFVQQRLQGPQIGRHVAIGRVDDDGGPLHHMVAGEEQLFFLQQKAQVVGGVARRVDHAQRGVVASRDAVPMLRQMRRAEVGVLPRRVVGDAAPHRRAGSPRKCRRAGRVVAVGVGDEDALDAARRCQRGHGSQHDLQVVAAGSGDLGTRVDQRPALATADQVAVGARPGHRPRVGRGDAQDARRQLHHAAGPQRAVHIAAAGRVEAADFGIGPFVRQHHARAIAGDGAARHHQRHLRLRTHPGQRCGGGVVLLQIAQQLARHWQQLQATRTVQRLRRGQPHQFYRLGEVGLGLLACRRPRGEEAGVEALRAAHRGEPVRAVDKAAQVELQTRGGAELGHARLARLHANAPGLQCRQVDVAHRQQQTHFLEGLAHRSDGVVEPAQRHTQLPAGAGVVGAQAVPVGSTVACVELTTREDGGTAALVAGTLGSAQHQHLDALRAIAQQQQRCRQSRVGRRGVSGGAHLATPLLRSAAISCALKPASASTSAVCAPVSGAGRGSAAGVRSKRGAGAGCTTPPTLT